jgi:hypothetical protein
MRRNVTAIQFTAPATRKLRFGSRPYRDTVMEKTKRTTRKANPAASKPPPLVVTPTAPVTDGFLLKREVAARLRKKPRTIERWMALGILPFIKVGKGRRAAVLFKWADVEATLQTNYGCGGSN